MTALWIAVAILAAMLALFMWRAIVLEERLRRLRERSDHEGKL